MAENSNISWTDHTFNPWWGCTKVSDGCKHCYAERDSKRYGKDIWGPLASREARSEAYWRQPLRWDREAAAVGERRRVFCASMADVFEGPETCQNPEAWAMMESARLRLWETIAATPNLDWLLLTKRPENILPTLQRGHDSWEQIEQKAYDIGARDAFNKTAWLEYWLHGTPPPNVWIGTSAEDQNAAGKRIPALLEVPAAVRFLSCEPLLGPVDLYNGTPDPRLGGLQAIHTFIGDWWEPGDNLNGPSRHGVDWVICGGESGPHARPMHPDWARSLRDQCEAAGVAFFMKQWGEWRSATSADLTDPTIKTRIVSVDGAVHETWEDADDHVNCRPMARVGKHSAGRLLDGRTWDEFPEVQRCKSLE